MAYTGSCHCGKIAIEVEGTLDEAMECNCSICRRRGHLLWFVPRDKLTLKTPASNLSTYMFNKHEIAHHFCGTCGCSPFGESEKMGMAAVNVRCLPDVELSGLKIKHYDGKSL